MAPRIWKPDTNLKYLYLHRDLDHKSKHKEPKTKNQRRSSKDDDPQTTDEQRWTQVNPPQASCNCNSQLRPLATTHNPLVLGPTQLQLATQVGSSWFFPFLSYFGPGPGSPGRPGGPEPKKPEPGKWVWPTIYYIWKVNRFRNPGQAGCELFGYNPQFGGFESNSQLRPLELSWVDLSPTLQTRTQRR